MVKVILSTEGFVIENKLLFGYEQPNPKLINLATMIGEDLVSQQQTYDLIEYPGEYDIKNVSIECIVGAKDHKLNYLINVNSKKVGVIQSPDILEEEEVSGMDFRLYTDDLVAKKIDQLELEGKQFKLDRENGVTEIELKDEKNENVDIKVSKKPGQDEVQVEVE